MRLNTCAFTVTAISQLGLVAGLFIGSNIVTQALGGLESDISDIASGVFYTVLDNTATSFTDINNQGDFYLTGSASASAAISFGGDAFVNSGVTSCDSLKSNSQSSFSIAPSASFENTGLIFLGLGEIAAAAVGFTITAASSWSNTGMIVLKASGSCSADIGGTDITNEGSICLYLSIWASSNNIGGEGCIAIHAESSFSTAADSCSIPSSQVIHLGAESSVFAVTGLGGLGGSLFRRLSPCYTVAGFGAGNKILVDFLFDSYDYDSEQGILTLSSLFNTASFNIGCGYDYDSFVSDSGSSFFGLLGSDSNCISYNDQAPNPIPSSCACSPDFPVAPSTAVSSSTVIASKTVSTVKPSSSTVATSTSSSKAVPTTTSTTQAAPTTSSKAVPTTSSTTHVAPTTSSTSSKAVPTTSSTTKVAPTTTSTTAAATSSDSGDDWT